MAEPQSKPSLFPTFPNITTTISSMLSSSTTQTGNSQTTGTIQNEMPTPASSTSIMPSFTLPNASTWWKRTTAKPENKTTAEDTTTHSRGPSNEISRRGSDDSIGEFTKKRSRASRPKTSYSICHAPPRHNGRQHKIKVRARPLLQLHQLGSRSRPRPAFELLPSAIFSPRLIKAIAKFSNSKHTLSPMDFAVVRAEPYNANNTSSVDDVETHDILALICGIGRGHVATEKVRISFEQGVQWEAYRLPTGAYECTTTDTHGLTRTVRWVPKRQAKGASTSSVDAVPEVRFNFSTISANTRRHPVIAHLSPTSLDISDVYSIPAPGASIDAGTAISPGSPPFSRTSSDGLSTAADATTTTEELRNLITASAIYVAICEGWCTSNRSEDSLSRSASLKSASPSKSPLGMEGEGMRRSSSLRQALRPGGTRRRANSDAERPSSQGSNTAPDQSNIPTIPEAITPVASRRRRADTTSTVIVNGNGGQWRPNYDDETDDEEEDHHGEDSAKSTAQSSPDLGATKSEQSSIRRRRSTNSEKKRHFSDGSGASGDSMAKEKEKERKVMPQVTVTPKKGLLSKLLCGMV